MSLEPLSVTDSYFTLLGVPVGVDDATLSARFKDLSRRYHPDRWATADAATQAAALDSSALVNDAFRTLRDPFTRAEYLLRRERGTRPDTAARDQKPPQELFARVLELQEALMEYQEAAMEDDDATLARVRPDLEAAKTEFEAAYETLRGRLAELFARYDAGERDAALDGLGDVVGTRGYLRRVLTNLDKTLNQPT